MMIPSSVLGSYSSLRKVISDAAMDDLDSLMVSVLPESPRVQREALRDVMPDLGDRYVGATSMVAAEFFDELMSLQDVAKPVRADTLLVEDPNRWRSLVDWSAADYVFERLGADAVFSRLAGGLTKILTEAAADTMIGNAEQQLDNFYSAQRVPQPGCCAFCSMLASRGAVYTERSATGVVGRGTPIGSHRLAKGIRPRGSRKLGEQFHDYCRCEVVILTQDNQAELLAIQEQHLAAYENAAQNADEGRSLAWKETTLKDGTTKRTHHWVKDGQKHTAADKTSDILASMRAELGIK
ncbi:hypothetical protein [Auritidibacter ignavus]|uniref:VG15 protein n=1 Tax=Auritidibacter ignavus TaxID=678932 RepID=UPI0011C472A1|nr:hypothetical protein [Auritidibacter ignavus]NIH72223.1 hypothetical protein [Auritidibacter ignavus]WGH91715.1 hypothetical protein QDX23_04975 [Auritidibacter ignavus]WHS27545.1 hypothetical protein QM395_09200 [Auritidibacter ignavus]